MNQCISSICSRHLFRLTFLLSLMACLAGSASLLPAQTAHFSRALRIHGSAAAVTGAPSAWASENSTSTALTVTAGGGAVTQVPALTVVTLTATVQAGGTAVQLGTVNFCDVSAKSCADIHLLGTAQLTKAGTATMKFRPGIGSHSYKAVFLRTKSDAGSASSAAVLTVTKPTVTGGYPTTTTIAQSGNPEDYTLTATVSGPRDVSSPTGTVSFEDTSDGNSVLDTATLGPGAPGFSWLNSQNIWTSYNPQGVVEGDFNGDGILDLASPRDSGVTILLGKGDGTFAAKSNVEGCGVADDIWVADFNGDGIPDIAVTCPPYRAVNTYLGNGDGTFTFKSSSAAGNWTNGVVAADFNGDGILDLAVANAPCCDSPLTPYLTILLGNGDGTFTAAPNVPAPGFPWSVSVGDFNSDGIPDLAFSNSYASINSVSILLGNGDGTFTAAASPAVGGGAANVLVGDFNSDGKLDLAVENGVFGNKLTVTLLLGNGDGTFTATPESPITFAYPSIICTGDFDDNGILDLAVLNRSDDTVRYLLGKGDGTFTTTVASPPVIGNIGWWACDAGDFNGDGISDMAVTLYPVSNFTVSVLLTQPTQTATATASGISIAGSGQHQADAVYFGDDNHKSSASGTVGLTTVSGPHLAFTTVPPASLQAGKNPGTVAVSVEDSSNKVVTTSSATVTLTVTGPNSYSKVYTATAASGVATFSSLTSLASTGTYMYTATDVPDGLTQAVVSESVWTPHLAFSTAPPASLLAGQSPGTAVVSVEDSSNKVVTTSTAIVTLKVTGPGGYSHTYTATAVSGVAGFSNLAALSTAGTYTYTATDIPDGLTQAVANESITLSPPVGYLDGAVDNITGNTTVPQSDQVLVYGWAADWVDGAPLSNVKVYIDGALAGTPTLGIARPGVAAAWNNNAFLISGYKFLYSAVSLSLGAHKVAVVALDSHGLSTTFGPRTFTVAASPPFGYLGQAVDSVNGATTVRQADSLKVVGWVADAADGAPLANVTVSVDGVSIGTPTLGIARPDVAKAYNNNAYLNSGYRLLYPASSLAVGIHMVTAVATDAGGRSTTFGPLAITVQ
ncbi:MAG TPA: VCBS repeat-containing protein [Terracidiphilus sp.]|jgi:hypothetical protein